MYWNIFCRRASPGVLRGLGESRGAEGGKSQSPLAPLAQRSDCLFHGGRPSEMAVSLTASCIMLPGGRDRSRPYSADCCSPQHCRSGKCAHRRCPALKFRKNPLRQEPQQTGWMDPFESLPLSCQLASIPCFAARNTSIKRLPLSLHIFPLPFYSPFSMENLRTKCGISLQSIVSSAFCFPQKVFHIMWKVRKTAF